MNRQKDHFCSFNEEDLAIFSGKLRRKGVRRDHCLVWTGCLTSDQNYGVITRNMKCCSKQKPWRVNRIAFALANYDGNLETFSEILCDSSFHISHLCHNSLCIQYDHLSRERQIVNNNRIACHNYMDCYGHNERDCLL